MRFRLQNSIRLAAAFAMLGLCLQAAAKGAPHAGVAANYPAVDTHPQEHVSIAADPYDTPEKIKLFRIDYLEHDILPIRIIITNDGDKPLNLTDVRIQFISANNDAIPAALEEELQRRVVVLHGSSNAKIPLPLPIPLLKHKSILQKLKQDLDEFSFVAFVVEPHTTQSGYLFYDVSGLPQPALKSAQLYVKRIHDTDGQDLFNFAIPFDKYLAK